jgi:hypothetical protein
LWAVRPEPPHRIHPISTWKYSRATLPQATGKKKTFDRSIAVVRPPETFPKPLQEKEMPLLASKNPARFGTPATGPEKPSATPFRKRIGMTARVFPATGADDFKKHPEYKRDRTNPVPSIGCRPSLT